MSTPNFNNPKLLEGYYILNEGLNEEDYFIIKETIKEFFDDLKEYVEKNIIDTEYFFIDIYQNKDTILTFEIILNSYWKQNLYLEFISGYYENGNFVLYEDEEEYNLTYYTDDKNVLNSVESEELEKIYYNIIDLINEFFEKNYKNYGFEKLELLGIFSNGEAIYQKVE